MKNISGTLILSCLIVFCISCRKALKDVNDYYPSVKTVSATVLTDGSVELKGEIIKKGESEIYYAGFCVDTLAEPKMLSAQGIGTLEESFFVFNYPAGFDPETRYYFRSWAANEYGYSYGDIIYLDSIKPEVNAPCSLVLNTADPGEGMSLENYLWVDPPTNNSDEYEIKAKTNQRTYTLRFGSAPVTKIYKTVVDFSPEPDQVYIFFNSGWSSYSLNSGSSVYVNKTSATTWEITICDAPWDLTGSITLLLNTRFNCPFN